MYRRWFKIRPLACCSLCSILVHLLFIFSLRMLGSYHFGAAVNQPLCVMVDLAATATAAEPANLVPGPQSPVAQAPETENAPQVPTAAERSGPEVPETSPPEPAPASVEAATVAAKNAEQTETSAEAKAAAVASHTPAEGAHPAGIAAPTPTMLSSLSVLLAAKNEKLTYLVSMHGLPIGSAELESKNERGGTVITLRMKSNAAISSFFLVDDEIETRHIDGMFIMTNIRQQEGSFRSDESFTINLKKQRVSWADFRTPRSMTIKVPSSDVLDTLSGIYYLRNRGGCHGSCRLC